MTTLGLVLFMNLVKDFEGCKLEAYKCPAGKWTIGYGHTGPEVKRGLKWSQTQCDEQLKKDLQKYWLQVVHLAPSIERATPGQQAALADFVYNCGAENCRKSTFLKSVILGSWDKASQDIMLWNKARNPKTGNLEVLPGLTRRRLAESKLILGT